jgi:hypothetical protein
MAKPATVEQELPDNQVLLPVAAVFFLPKSSALSPLALDIVAQTARRADPGSIVIIRANHDHEAGETSQTNLRQRPSAAMRCAMNWSVKALPTQPFIF